MSDSVTPNQSNKKNLSQVDNTQIRYGGKADDRQYSVLFSHDSMCSSFKNSCIMNTPYFICCYITSYCTAQIYIYCQDKDNLVNPND